MVGYAFYIGTYAGDQIPQEAFDRCARRAEDVLARCKRIYRVSAPDQDSEPKALCAMAEEIFRFEQLRSGGVLSSVSVGSVSEGYDTSRTDVSPKAESAALYRAAQRYLRIYRGC